MATAMSRSAAYSGIGVKATFEAPGLGGVVNRSVGIIYTHQEEGRNDDSGGKKAGMNVRLI